MSEIDELHAEIEGLRARVARYEVHLIDIETTIRDLDHRIINNADRLILIEKNWK